MAMFQVYINYCLVAVLLGGIMADTSSQQVLMMPQITTNLTSITLQWECTSYGNITSYHVTYSPATMPGDTIMVAISENNESTIINGLVPRTTYMICFDVTAVCRNGTAVTQRGRLEPLTTEPQNVSFLLNGVLYGNNSIVTLDEIGEDSAALFCLTNKTDCCNGDQGGQDVGGWFYPTGNPVNTDTSSDPIYRDRGPSFVRLQRKNNIQTTGVFRCEVPDASGTNQQLYVGVYPVNSGSPSITGLVYNPSTLTLTCTSTSGPATTVTWRKNGSTINIGVAYIQEQTIINATLGEYQSHLIINSCAMIQNITGNYTCNITNMRGSSESEIIEVPSSAESENDTTPQDTGSTTCTSQDIVSNTPQYTGLPKDEGTASTTHQETAFTTSRSQDTGSITPQNNQPVTSQDMTFTTLSTTQSQYTVFTTHQGRQTTTPQITASTTPTIDTAKPLNVVNLATGVSLALLMFCIAIGLILTVGITTCWIKRRRKFKFFQTAGDHQNIYDEPSVSVTNNYTVSTLPVDSMEEVELSVSECNIVTNVENDKTKCAESHLTEQEQINDNSMTQTESESVMDHSKNIPISEFGQHVEKMHSETDKLFETEYKTLSNVSQASHDVASAPYNKIRNRFVNIHPYDFSRVTLKEIPGEEGSDYINTSYIDGYRKPKAYIAAQGPKPNTVTDFWRMIWEYKLPTVVMLTRCFEGRKKCEAYWPEEVNGCTEPGQDLMITLTTQLDFADYSIRNMRVKCTSDSHPPLEVTQFHFLGWPDHGVPNNAMTVINFIRRVRKTHPFTDERHLLVHCSAGVGRTGTFIVLDSMLQRMKQEDSVNIYESVRHLRTQRVQMVQTQAQYSFIHDAFNELIICGETEIAASKLTDVVKALSETNEENGTTGFEEQFQTLDKLSPEFVEENYSQALHKNNTSKNRYVDKLPNNSHRVYLRPATFEDSDYINASFIDGYRRRGGYIATQGPLESTVSDFWRMMMNYESSCIVMLCGLQEDDKESSHCYWPTSVESSEFYGNIEVKLTSEDEGDDYIVRKFEVKEERPHPVLTSSPSSLTVSQFQFLRWSQHSPPQTTTSLLELVEMVNKVQMSSGNKAITVMCNDGVGRSGTFICIHSQLERLKTEGVVDFFQVVKAARIQRAGLVPQVAQYMMCHEVLAKYLDSFEMYANFKE